MIFSHQVIRQLSKGASSTQLNDQIPQKSSDMTENILTVFVNGPQLLIGLMGRVKRMQNSDKEMQKKICAALRNLSGHTHIQLSDFSAQRLGGLTNMVFQVELENQSLVVRLPGDGTEEFIDRHVELNNARAAEQAGISAEIVWADPDSGIMISEFIHNAATMTPELFRQRKGSLERVAKCLKALHSSGVGFDFQFDLFGVIDSYCLILENKQQAFPTGFSEAIRACSPIKQKLLEANIELAPCHCDPLSENFLDDGKRVWLVDWEYSGMNDPLWDLGDLSVEAEFDVDQDQRLLQAYYGRDATQSELGRMVMYKATCDLLWALWGLIQHVNGADAEDYYVYALQRFARCDVLMKDQAFQDHLNAIH